VRYVLALDEGTTSARAALYDNEGNRVGIASVPIECAYPHPGWVEQDAESLWLAQWNAARRLLDQASIAAADIAAIGITNQRETTVIWDRATGRPINPAIVWQCRRTADACSALAKSEHGPRVTSLTGLVVDAYFSASKIQWILDNVPDARSKARNGDLLFGTVDTWLTWRLTNGAVHATDYSNASRTMLMNIERGGWDSDLLSLFDVPAAMLPEIRPSSYVFGEADPQFIGAAVPISGIAGDQQAALAGQACFKPGLSKNTYGTGCFALMHTGTHRPVSKNQLVATRAASLSDVPQYAVEGSVFVAGAAVKWLRDQLGFVTTAAETEAIATSIADTRGVYLVPAFVGLGAPYWDGNARAIYTGMSFASGRPELVRAALESIAYQTRDLVEAMEADSGQVLEELRVDGGASANNFLMQFQADVLGKPIVRPADIETTALGAAYLAGVAVGYWESINQVEQFWRAERTFEPRMSASRRDSLYSGWRDAVARARS